MEIEQEIDEKRIELFNSLNDFFDNIYIITLQKSTDRQERFKKILTGLNYEVFWGVNGHELSSDKLYEDDIYSPELAKIRNISKSELSPGEIGCALSHLGIYRDLIENDYQRVLILEDDISIDFNALKKISFAFNELPERWDLLYLGYLYNNLKITPGAHFRIKFLYPLFNRIGLNRYSVDELRNRYPSPFSEHLDKSGYHYGTHAYGITKEGAKKVLQFQKPVTMAIDNAIGAMIMHNLLQAFKVKERVFYQDRNMLTTIK